MSITHAKVASDPQTPRLTDTDWNAAHSNPTLAEVLVAGNDPGVTTYIQAALGAQGNGAYLEIDPDPGTGTGGNTSLGAADGAAGFAGGQSLLTGGAGGPTGFGFGANIAALGAQADGTGGNASLTGGSADAGSGKRGGDVSLLPGPGDGAGRNGLVFLNLPTSDPGVSGALYSLAGVVKVSP